MALWNRKSHRPQHQRPTAAYIASCEGKHVTLTMKQSLSWDDGSTYTVSGIVKRTGSIISPWDLRTDEGAYVNLVDEYVGPNCVNPSIVHIQGE